MHTKHHRDALIAEDMIKPPDIVIHMNTYARNVDMFMNTVITIMIMTMTAIVAAMTTIMSTITMMRSVNAAVDIITMTKSMNTIMKQWSMSLVLCRQV